jgi:zinc protease
MKRVLSAVVLVVLAATGLRAQDVRLDVDYEQVTLPNGLNVILQRDTTIPMVAVNVWYHAGSAREKPGRTGFAHLFEHIMFEGSGHVAEGKFDQWLEAAGGVNNGSTTEDRTNYYELVPSNALDLALFLESDRMGYLLDAMSPEKVDGQRDVVKNERRFRVDNRPYGKAFLAINELLYPPDHPYSWPVIGSMEDLSAASFEDVLDFHRTWYAPGNASLAIVGDFDPAILKERLQYWFGDVDAGPAVGPVPAPPAFLAEEKRVVMEDRVQLPRLYMCWLSAPIYQPGDAELDIAANTLAGGKTSRLYKRLVYDMEIAQDVSAFQGSGEVSSQFCIVSTARAGHDLNEIETVIQEELDLLKAEGPSDREVQRALNQYEAGFLGGSESLLGLADRLNGYYFRTGNPDYFNEDLARYKALSRSDVRAVVRSTLRDNGRLVLSVVPEGRTDLAATKKLASEE